MILRRVLLPLPVSPIIPILSPEFMVNETSFTAKGGLLLYANEIFFNSRESIEENDCRQLSEEEDDDDLSWQKSKIIFDDFDRAITPHKTYIFAVNMEGDVVHSKQKKPKTAIADLDSSDELDKKYARITRPVNIKYSIRYLGHVVR